MKRKSTLKFFSAIAGTVLSLTASAQLYDNGPFINSVGTGPSGTDESWLFDASLSMGNFGYGASSGTFYRVADDFVVPVGTTWNIDSVYFYCYQTNAPVNVSPITAVNIRVWDDGGGSPGTTLLYGDTTTNRLVRSAWTNSYRVLESATGTSSARGIFKNVCNTPGLSLPAGTYWIDWQFTGSSSFSGPWANPIVITGNATTGNGVQEAGAQNPWNAAMDPGSNTQQGFPFVFYGSSVSGINETSLVNNVSLFPNPATSFVDVSINKQSGKKVKIEMINMLGEVISSEEISGEASSTEKIDCSAIAPGIYFIKISSGSDVVTCKFSKI